MPPDPPDQSQIIAKHRIADGINNGIRSVEHSVRPPHPYHQKEFANNPANTIGTAFRAIALTMSITDRIPLV